MYEIRANKNHCPSTLANYLTDWSPVVCGYCEGAHRRPSPSPSTHPIKRPLAAKKKKKKFLYSHPFLFFVRRLHFFFLPHFGMAKWGRTVGFFRSRWRWCWLGVEGALCARAVTEGARTAVSGSLKRFSQAEIFNLLRENKAEKKQRTKRS